MIPPFHCHCTNSPVIVVRKKITLVDSVPGVRLHRRPKVSAPKTKVYLLKRVNSREAGSCKVWF